MQNKWADAGRDDRTRLTRLNSQARTSVRKTKGTKKSKIGSHTRDPVDPYSRAGRADYTYTL